MPTTPFIPTELRGLVTNINPSTGSFDMGGVPQTVSPAAFNDTFSPESVMQQRRSTENGLAVNKVKRNNFPLLRGAGDGFRGIRQSGTAGRLATDSLIGAALGSAALYGLSRHSGTAAPTMGGLGKASLIGAGSMAAGGLLYRLLREHNARKAEELRKAGSATKSASGTEVLVSLLLRVLDTDPTIGTGDKKAIVQEVARMDGMKQQQLINILGTVSGAGAGAAIAKFVFGSGLIGTLAGAAMGGMFGSGLTSKGRHNAFGHYSPY